MNFSKQWLSIEEARQTAMVDYLSRLGYEPARLEVVITGIYLPYARKEIHLLKSTKN